MKCLQLTWLKKSKERCGPGHDVSVEYEITNEHRVKTWKTYKEKWSNGTLVRWCRDNLDKYWKGTIWQRLAHDRQTWTQHGEAFAQPRDTAAAQWWWWLLLMCWSTLWNNPMKSLFDHSVGQLWKFHLSNLIYRCRPLVACYSEFYPVLYKMFQ